MENRKGLGNSVFALITSASLITGLTLLSLTSSPYSIAANATQNQSTNPDMSNISLPENTSVNASNYVNREQAQNLASKNPDLVTSIAKKLFELMSGKQLQPPQPGNISMGGNNTTLPENITENITEPSENITKPSNTTENNTTGNETETETPSDNPENSTDSDNTTEPQNTTDNQTSPEQEGNNTFNNTFDGFNQTGGNTTAENLGFLQQIAKTFSQLFTGEETGSKNQTSDSQQNQSDQPEPEQPQEPENPDQNGSQTEDDKSQQQQTESSPLSNIPVLPLTAVLAASFLAVIYYRSDKDGKEFLKTLLNRLKSVVTSIPDLFRRTVVNTVSFVIDRMKGLADFIVALAHKPGKTVNRIKEATVQKINRLKNWLKTVRNRSVKENLKIALKGGETESYEGLDQVWYRLKQKLKLENSKTVTPAEVRAEAIRQGLPDQTVEKVVDAFRREKYSSEGYPGELEISKWNRDLDGDEE